MFLNLLFLISCTTMIKPEINNNIQCLNKNCNDYRIVTIDCTKNNNIIAYENIYIDNKFKYENFLFIDNDTTKSTLRFELCYVMNDWTIFYVK